MPWWWRGSPRRARSRFVVPVLLFDNAPSRPVASSAAFGSWRVRCWRLRLPRSWIELGFDVRRVVSAFGTAPLPPVARNDLAAIGRTNDAILYGARVVLFVRGDDASIETIGPKVPSSASKAITARTVLPAIFLPDTTIDFYQKVATLTSSARPRSFSTTSSRAARFPSARWPPRFSLTRSSAPDSPAGSSLCKRPDQESPPSFPAPAGTSRTCSERPGRSVCTSTRFASIAWSEHVGTRRPLGRGRRPPRARRSARGPRPHDAAGEPGTGHLPDGFAQPPGTAWRSSAQPTPAPVEISIGPVFISLPD